jgi:tellurite resistance protein
MVLRGLFRGSKEPEQPQPEPAAPQASAFATESIRQIAEQIEALPIEQRRYIAGFSYVLARAAHADLEISEDELKYMEHAVVEVGHLSEAQAVMVVEMARNMSDLYGATDDYVVTRRFTEISTRDQREDLLRTAFAVGAADNTISAAESAELNEIGKELGFRADEVDAIRDEFRDKLAAVQSMRAALGTQR